MIRKTFGIVAALAYISLGCGQKTNASEHADHSDEHGQHAGEHENQDEHGEHEEHGREHEGSLKLSAAAIERNEIQVASVSVEAFAAGVNVPAEVTLIPDKVAHVTSLVAGQITSANASVGDKVTRNAVLATLRSVELGQARSELVRAEAALASARANYERQQTLAKEGIGAQRSLQEAKAQFEQAQADMESATGKLNVYGAIGRAGATVTLKAPIAGTVIERHATSGEVTKPDEPLFVIADTSSVWVVGRVYEQNLAHVNHGSAVTVRLAAYPGKSWPGTIEYIATVLDERTRTVPVRVTLPNPDGALRPGLFGTMTLADQGETAAIPVVPETAIQRVEDQDVVFVPGEEPGEFHATKVQVVGRRNGKAGISKGLTANDKVVVKGAFVLKSELQKDEMGEGHAH